MNEYNVTNVENTETNVSPNTSEDSMFMVLFKHVFVLLIGGLIVKIFIKIVNWFKEGSRLRREEKERKQAAEFDKRVEEKAQEMLDELLAADVKKSKEESDK